MPYIVVFGSDIIVTYVTIISTSAWLRDSILCCTVPLFNCSLTSLKRMAVTSAVQSSLQLLQGRLRSTQARCWKKTKSVPLNHQPITYIMVSVQITASMI